MQGLSNDFVLIDERKICYNLSSQNFKTLADRRVGIGCDQVLYIKNSDEEIEELQKKIADKYGYKLVDHKLELYGIKKK